MEKILIIDDFEPFRSTACRVVERLGFQALPASDGREGLDVFARERPGIVITDLQIRWNGNCCGSARSRV